MAKYQIGDRVITTEGCFGIPVGTVGKIVEIYWEDCNYDVKACYGVEFAPEYHNSSVWCEDDWSYFETQIKLVGD